MWIMSPNAVAFITHETHGILCSALVPALVFGLVNLDHIALTGLHSAAICVLKTLAGLLLWWWGCLVGAIDLGVGFLFEASQRLKDSCQQYQTYLVAGWGTVSQVLAGLLGVVGVS